jgi:8-amino-7-oxononanoate synthase
MAESECNSWIEHRMQHVLKARSGKGTLRKLPCAPLLQDAHESLPAQPMDFSSNDYLGLARSASQMQLVESTFQNVIHQQSDMPVLGTTGSRLLSGDSPYIHHVEATLARIHRRPAALICNSGYDANLSVVSSLPCDTILYDAYIHNSLHMGLRLWLKTNDNEDDDNQHVHKKQAIQFRHNNVQHLQELLQAHAGRQIVIVIETVYSMDGDTAPVKDILDVAHRFGAQVVVDEAHGLGVCGRPPTKSDTTALPGTGVVAFLELEDHPALYCAIYTFGKAAGCHGAIICGSQLLKDYLINYGYPFIYSTALPLHSLVTLECSYRTMTSAQGDALRRHMVQLVRRFQTRIHAVLTRTHSSSIRLLANNSPIQALMIPGNDACTRFCQVVYTLSQRRIRLFPIKSPTVPEGLERVRIVLHAHNTEDEVDMLVHCIERTLKELVPLHHHSRL